MPAKKKIAQDGGWGLTYADVSQSLQEHQAQYNCTLEFAVHHYQKYKASTVWVWVVTCSARYRRGTPQEICGLSSCEVGHGSGSATFPGAYLRSLIQACDNLEARRSSPTKAQEIARLPGF